MSFLEISDFKNMQQPVCAPEIKKPIKAKQMAANGSQIKRTVDDVETFFNANAGNTKKNFMRG